MNPGDIWKTVLAEIEVDLGKSTTKINFSNSRLLSLEKGIARISLATNLARETVEKRYYVLLQNALERQSKEKLSLVFEVIKPELAAPAGPLFETLNFPEQVNKPDISRTDSFNLSNTEEQYRKTGLNPKYSLKSLVVGASNNFAHAAAMTICKNPGKEYNPFFIYGGVGVGKTHLMQAIGNELFVRNSNLRILYITAEHFMNDLVASLQQKTMPAFKKRYREVDVLLVDDIQFISKKEAMQDEFFYTFNSLFMGEKQIILTSDRPPQEIQVEDRLLSRLMGGLAADIQTPDLEMRIAIIKQKLSARRENWDEASIEYLATRLENNIREIEGAMQKIMAVSQSANTPVNLDLVKKALGVANGLDKPPVPASPQKIISAVSKVFGIKQGDILSDKRDAEFVLPRQVIMFLLRTDCRIKLEEVARIMKRKDHTTVIHAVGKIEKQFADNQQLRQQILLIKREVWG